MLGELLSSSLARELIVVIISALPVVELRGALPTAMNLFHMPWYQALYLSIIGNLLPVPLLLLFFDSLAKVARRTEIGNRFIEWLLRRTWRQAGAIEKYKQIGLIVFIAIPLPGTGAWTGSLVAYLLGLRFGQAFLSIAIGVIGAGAIVIALVLMGWLGVVIAGIGLVLLALIGIWKM